MIYWQFIILLAVHWVADFVFQTRWQAINKSHNDLALARHVGVYTLALTLPAAMMLRPVEWLFFIVVNGVMHFATDYFTSRWTTYFYKKGDYHNFFVIIGLDQLIHQVTLALTFWNAHA